MTISSRPAPARTDVSPALPAVPGATGVSPATVRRVGAGLAVGTALWASTMVIWGSTATGFGGRMGDLAGLAFQLGLFGLLQVQLRTRATGLRPPARPSRSPPSSRPGRVSTGESAVRPRPSPSSSARRGRY